MDGSPRTRQIASTTSRRTLRGQLRQALALVRTSYTYAEVRELIIAQDAKITQFLVDGLMRLPAYIRTKRLPLTIEPRVTWVIRNAKNPSYLLELRSEYVALYEQVCRRSSLEPLFKQHLGVEKPPARRSKQEEPPDSKPTDTRARNIDPQPKRDFDQLLCQRALRILEEAGLNDVQIVCHTIGIGTDNRFNTEPYAVQITLSWERRTFEEPAAPTPSTPPPSSTTEGDGAPPTSP